MSPRVRVKICGLTHRADAEVAIALGADALGFNLFPGSKRHLDPSADSTWLRTLPPFVTRVAVVVNLPLDEARAVSARPEFDLVQFHGDEDPAYCAEFARLGRPFIKALRLRAATDLASADGFSTPHLLLDAHAGAAYGGTGRLIDLPLAAECVRRFPALHIILAGGLQPENVRAAVSTVRPFAVDVASGVEVAGDPRRKCPERLARFLAEARG